MTQLHLVYRRGTPIMGPCCRCKREENTDGSPVTWRCQACKDFVCRDCTMTIKKEAFEYLETTLCSEECRLAHRVQTRMLNQSTEDDD